MFQVLSCGSLVDPLGWSTEHACDYVGLEEF